MVSGSPSLRSSSRTDASRCVSGPRSASCPTRAAFTLEQLQGAGADHAPGGNDRRAGLRPEPHDRRPAPQHEQQLDQQGAVPRRPSDPRNAVPLDQVPAAGNRAGDHRHAVPGAPGFGSARHADQRLPRDHGRAAGAGRPDVQGRQRFSGSSSRLPALPSSAAPPLLRGSSCDPPLVQEGCCHAFEVRSPADRHGGCQRLQLSPAGRRPRRSRRGSGQRPGRRPRRLRVRRGRARRIARAGRSRLVSTPGSAASALATAIRSTSMRLMPTAARDEVAESPAIMA